MVLIQGVMQVSDTTATESTSVVKDTTINFGDVDTEVEDSDDDKIIEEFFGYNPNKIFLIQRIDSINSDILYYVDKREDAIQVMTALLEKEIDSIDKKYYKVFKSLGSNGSVGISTQKIRYVWNSGMVKRCTYEVLLVNKVRLPKIFT